MKPLREPRKIVKGVRAIQKRQRLGQVLRVPVGSMVTADYKPDRLRQYTDARGKVLYQRRG